MGLKILKNKQGNIAIKMNKKLIKYLGKKIIIINFLNNSLKP